MWENFVYVYERGRSHILSQPGVLIIGVTEIVLFISCSTISQENSSRTYACYRSFSHDVTAAMLVYENKGMAAILVHKTNPQGIELYFYVNDFYCFIEPI